MNISYFELLDVLNDDFDDHFEGYADELIDRILLGFSPSIHPHSEDHDDSLALFIEAL